MFSTLWLTTNKDWKSKHFQLTPFLLPFIFPGRPKGRVKNQIKKKKDKRGSYIRVFINSSSCTSQSIIWSWCWSRQQQGRVVLKLEVMKRVKTNNTNNSLKKEFIGLLRFLKIEVRVKLKENKIIFSKLTHSTNFLILKKHVITWEYLTL